jgi:hypothetical protein
MRRVAVAVLLVVGPTTFVACGELLATDDEQPFVDASPFEAADDADVAPDVSLDADAGPPNLLVNPGFESGCTAFWTGANATITDTTADADVRSGLRACFVCKNNASANAAQHFQIRGGALPGERYVGKIWVKRPLVDGSARQAELNIEGNRNLVTTSTADWTQIVTGYVVPLDSGARNLDFSFRFVDDPGACLLVDDAILTKE